MATKLIAGAKPTVPGEVQVADDYERRLRTAARLMEIMWLSLRVSPRWDLALEQTARAPMPGAPPSPRRTDERAGQRTLSVPDSGTDGFSPFAVDRAGNLPFPQCTDQFGGERNAASPGLGLRLADFRKLISRCRTCNSPISRSTSDHRSPRNSDARSPIRPRRSGKPHRRKRLCSRCDADLR
jgi:hypothetical protein